MLSLVGGVAPALLPIPLISHACELSPLVKILIGEECSLTGFNMQNSSSTQLKFLKKGGVICGKKFMF